MAYFENQPINSAIKSIANRLTKSSDTYRSIHLEERVEELTKLNLALIRMLHEHKILSMEDLDSLSSRYSNGFDWQENE